MFIVYLNFNIVTYYYIPFILVEWFNVPATVLFEGMVLYQFITHHW